MKVETLLVNCDPEGVSLQQIPPEIREAFKPSPGHKFVSIDYSQMEYRVFASLSQDPNLLSAINSGRDFHKEIAAMVFEVPSDKVTKEQRKKGKTLNLAMLYGMSEGGVAKELGVSTTEARKILNKYKDRFPIASKWTEQMKNKIRKEKKAVTYFGRVRNFGDGIRGLTDKEVNEAFNTVMQGTAADLIKISMIMTNKHLNKSGNGKLVLTLHDEILFEVKDAAVAEESENLSNIMKDIKPNKSWSELGVDVAVGSNWKEAS